jgi:hypothetical protein
VLDDIPAASELWYSSVFAALRRRSRWTGNDPPDSHLPAGAVRDYDRRSARCPLRAPFL